MVISIALLGFGASATFLALNRDRLVRNSDVMLPTLMFASSVSMAFAVRLSQFEGTQFDMYLLFSDSSHWVNLILTYIIFIIPFFFSSLAFSIIFVIDSKSIGKLYFFNLIGSGIGGLLTIGLMWIFFPHILPFAIAIIPLVSGILLLRKPIKKIVYLFLFTAVVSLLLNISFPQKIIPSQFKSISKTMNLPKAEILLCTNSPYGYLELVESPALRYAPSISLNFSNSLEPVKGLFNNGEWFGPVQNRIEDSSFTFLNFTTEVVLYNVWNINKVLLLKTGTGFRIKYALLKGIKKIVAVESNAAAISLLESIDKEMYSEKIINYKITTRSFFQSNKDHFDLISFPTVGSFGGNSGLYALQEDYDLTTETLVLAWDTLEEDGVLSISSWIDYPSRKPLRLLTTIVEMLGISGIDDPREFICIIQTWNTVTILIKKNGFNKIESNSIRGFCNSLSFDIVHHPKSEFVDRNKFNVLQDESLHENIDLILNGNDLFIEEYPFNLTPVSDDKPYFSQFIKLSNFDKLIKNYDLGSLPYFELGYLIVFLTFVLIVLISFILIILPLFKLGWKGNNKLWTILYFSSIGIGYMLIEILFIHKFILYLGSPIYSATAVISAMLIFSGIGSYFSHQSNLSIKKNWIIFIVILFLMLMYLLFSDKLFHATISYSLAVKFILSFLIIAPISFFMGIPFPTGIKYVSETQYNYLPWAIGINGCFSIIGTVTATIISVEFGHRLLLLSAIFIYSIPFGAITLRSKI